MTGALSAVLGDITKGAFGFPLRRAAGIAAGGIRDFMEHHEIPKSILLVACDEDTLRILQSTLRESP